MNADGTQLTRLMVNDNIDQFPLEPVKQLLELRAEAAMPRREVRGRTPLFCVHIRCHGHRSAPSSRSSRPQLCTTIVCDW
jgi:hypothetical protein